MDEPPILPDPEHEPQAQENNIDSLGGDPHDSVNPFAPSAAAPPVDGPVPRVHLPGSFWAIFAGSMAAMILLAFFLPGFAAPAIIALVAAVIRVPLLQRRLSRTQPHKQLPNPSVMLCSSWVFMFIAWIASSVAFVVICFPTGLLLMAIDQGNEMGIIIAMVLAGVAALVVYLFLGYLSLRLPV